MVVAAVVVAVVVAVVAALAVVVVAAVAEEGQAQAAAVDRHQAVVVAPAVAHLPQEVAVVVVEAVVVLVAVAVVVAVVVVVPVAVVVVVAAVVGVGVVVPQEGGCSARVVGPPPTTPCPPQRTRPSASCAFTTYWGFPSTPTKGLQVGKLAITNQYPQSIPTHI